MLFEDMIKAVRVKKGISQDRLADIIGECQATISTWETGRKIPEFKLKNAKTLERLAVFLDTTPECIIDSIKESRSSSAMRVQGAGLLSQEGFVKEQKDYIDSLGPGPLDVWYLGGSLLEILLDGSALLERSIVDNLGSGVDYHVVWALDCPDRRLLERSMSLFSKIGAAITGQAGRINHHGVFLFRHEDYDRDYYYDSCPLNGYFLSEIVDSYQRCGKEGIPGNLFNPVTPLCQVLQKRLIGVFSPFATTIVYVPRGIYRPTAAVYMVGVTPSRSGPELNGFRFFDDDRAVELSMIVKEIKRYQKE